MIALPVHLALVVAGMLLVRLVAPAAGMAASGPVASLPWWALGAAPLLWPLLALAARRASESAWHSRKAWLLRRATRAGAVLVPGLGFAALVLFTPWVGISRAVVDPLLGGPIPGWADLGLLVTFAPLAAGHALACSAPPGFRPRTLITRANVRIAQCALVWAALTAYLALSTLLAAHTPTRIWLEESTLLSLVLTLVALGVALVVLPRALIAFLRVEPLEGHPRFLAEGVAQRLGIAAPRLFRWDTSGELKNALVVSTTGPRPVLFSDAFLSDLSMEEFRAVVAHELGHVAGRHVFLMGALLFGTTLVLEVLLAPLLDQAWGPLLALGILALLLLLAGYVSRRVELEADLYALEATSDPAALGQALVRASGGRLDQRGWRHFSVLQRLTFWRAAHTDPGVGVRLRRGLERWRRAGQLMLGLGLALTLYRSLVAWPAEAYIVGVRSHELPTAMLMLSHLGPADFERAGYREFAAPDAVAELRRVTAYGARLVEQGASLETEALGERALAALEGTLEPAGMGLLFDPVANARVTEARALLDLALLIDAPDSAPLGAAVSGGRGFDPRVELDGAWGEVADLLSR